MNKLSLIPAVAALSAFACAAEPSGLPTKSLSAAPDQAAAPDHLANADAPSAREPQSAALDAGAGEAPGTTQDPAAEQVDGGDPTAGLGVQRCGEAPFRLVRLGARDMMGASGAPDLAGVSVTLAHCPERRFETGSDGGVMVLVSRNATSWIRFDKPGHVSWIVGEIAFDDTLPATPVTATMIPTKLAASVVPGLRPDGALVYVEVQGGLATGPETCRSPGGVTIAVKDHPEAVVLYRAAGSNAGYDRTTVTSDEGVALIAGLPPVGSVEVSASKPGCDYLLAYGDVNSRALIPIGRTPLAPGAITHQVFNPRR